MLKYAQLDSAGVCIGIAESTHPLNSACMIPISDDVDALWRKYTDGVWSTDTFEPKVTQLTKLEFQLRFTFDELVAIETAAETDAGVRVLQRQQQAAEFINLLDPNTHLGMLYLASKGLLTAARVDAILA